MIYVDNNATTALAPDVLDAMQPYWMEQYGNPSSVHAFGSRLMHVLDHVGEEIAKLLHADRKDDITFTSGGTESNNTILRALACHNPSKRHIITSTVEHSSIGNVLLDLELEGFEITRVPVDRDGCLDPDRLRDALRVDTAFVTLMWANNETGVLFPIAEISRIVREKNIPLHCDTVQAVGKVPIDLTSSPVDYLSISAHKMHGPKGIGALYARRGAPFRPLLLGGGQQNGRRGGTENVAGIAGFGKACENARAFLEDASAVKKVRALRDRLEKELLDRIPETEIMGVQLERLPNTSNMVFEGIEGEALLQLMSDHEIYASGGSACTAGTSEPSHVLLAMGYSERQALSAVRFSLSKFTTEDDISRIVEAMPMFIHRLRSLNTNAVHS